jgi:RHS repeat-associated protein
MTEGYQYDALSLHFTGKERDATTGLDNFGARYNSSSFGRFMSPDWSAKPVSVPYADFLDPQSLNLYAYVRNNPTTRADEDGHCELTCLVVIGVVAAIGLGVYAYHHFTKTVDKGFTEARESSKARQEAYDAAGEGNGKKADEKNAEADRKAKEALKTAAEATMEGAQLPGTSTGSDVGVKPEDGATAAITTVGLGAEVGYAKKKAEANANKQNDNNENKGKTSHPKKKEATDPK